MTAPSQRESRGRAWATLARLAVRRFGWLAPFEAARRVSRHLRLDRRSLQLVPIASQRTTPALADAVRWIGATDGAAGVRPLLFAHPDSTVEWRATLPARGRVSAWVGLLPEVWDKNRGGVRFAMRVTTPSGELLGERRLDMHPGTRRGDRRWRRMTLALGVTAPVDAPVEAIISLRTSLPEGADGAHAWAAWGDPRIERVRGFGERRRMLAAAVAARGWLGALVDASGATQPAVQTLAYEHWLAANTPGPEALAGLAGRAASLPLVPRFSVVMPVYNTDPRWLRPAIESVRAQVYPHWELCIADDASTSEATVRCLAEYKGDARIRMMRRATNGHISAASNDALALATGDYIALLDHDDELTPDALAEMAVAINDRPDADVLYSDEDKITMGGERCDPFFKPDWSPEHFLGQMYTCHLTVMRRTLVEALGGFRVGFEGTQDYDLWLRAVSRTPRIHHVAKVLYHWRKIPGSASGEVAAKVYALENMQRTLQEHAGRTGLEAEVEPGLALSLFRVKRRIQGAPEVAICIPGAAADAATVRRLAAATTWPHRRVLTAGDLPAPPPGGFNRSRAIAELVERSGTEYVVILGDGIEMITPGWIEGLLEYAQDPAVGVVGGKVRYPDGRLQHAGLVTGVCGVAAPIFHLAPGDSGGWNSGALTPRNYSAVSAAVMMTKRSVWDRVGGFDAALRRDFADVDYCLKVREAGHRIVYTPFVEACDHAAAPAAVPGDPDDRRTMEARWGEKLRRDPYYNPNLSADHLDCRPRT